MPSSTIVNARPVRQLWLCVPLMLGFVLAQPDLLLRAASNAVVVDAARTDNLSAVRKLIKERADVNALANDGSTALLWAAFHSNAEMTKDLLAAGATPALLGRRLG